MEDEWQESILEIHQRGVGYLGRICDALEKLAGIDILAVLDKSELESVVEDQEKGKEREVVDLDDEGEKTERVEDQMEGVEEGSHKGASVVRCPLVFNWRSFYYIVTSRGPYSEVSIPYLILPLR